MLQDNDFSRIQIQDPSAKLGIDVMLINHFSPKVLYSSDYLVVAQRLRHGKEKMSPQSNFIGMKGVEFLSLLW